VKNAKKNYKNTLTNQFSKNHKYIIEVAIADTARLSIPTFSCFCSDAVWFCMSGGWGSAIQEHHQHYDEERHGHL